MLAIRKLAVYNEATRLTLSCDCLQNCKDKMKPQAGAFEKIWS